MPIEERMELGKEYPLDYDGRYFLQTAERAMKGDIIRGLVELITNSDESYGRLERNGQKPNGIIKVTIDRKRKGKISIVQVLDFAEGMTLEEMIFKLKRLGGLPSSFLENKGVGSRGLMGRGSKECVVFGIVRFQSIKDNRYAEIQLQKPAIFKPIADRIVKIFDRVNLDIDKGNGTLVTIEIEPHFTIPNHDYLTKNLPKYYSLRDISSSSDRRLILIGNNKKTDVLSYEERNGEIIYDNKITIPNCPRASAHLVIRKSNHRIEPVSNSPYWEGGILVKSNYAIHGITALSRAIENNPYFENYFGKVICPYIDELAIDFEEREKNKRDHTPENPSRIIDPFRAECLVSNHPFTKLLYKEIADIVVTLLKNDEAESQKEAVEIENKRTKERFKKLANEVSKFIKESVEEADNFEDENYLTEADIPGGGMVVVPGGMTVQVGDSKKVYIYIKPASDKTEKHVLVSSESDAIHLSSEIVGLVDRGDGVWVNSLAIKGIKESEQVKVKLTWGDIVKYISVSVVTQIKTKNLEEDVQFEKDKYSIKEGKTKSLRLLAKWPEFICGRVKSNVTINNEKFCRVQNLNVIIDYNKRARDVFGRNVAIGIVRVKGLKTGGPVTISATIGKKEVSTQIRVFPKKEFGSNFEIKIVSEDFGDQRAVFVDNVLKINGRHKSLKRYLGSPESEFTGQDSIHFRILTAELIADTVAKKILELNSQRYPNRYKDLDVTGFYRQHRTYMNGFLERAHRIQIPDNEITKSNL